ncbi:MAG: CBS domain-containing protein, partial [Bacteroidota bacterium]
VDDKNQLIGIISLKDYNRILSSMMFFNKKRNEQLNKNLLQSLTATDVMTKQLVTLKPSASLMQAATLFKENRFCAIPIIDEEKGLLGILTTYDLLVFAYQEEPFTVHAA